MKSTIHNVAASFNARSTREKSRKPLPTVGTSMSRMERSGARSKSVNVWFSGRTNPKTVTSLGTSWALDRGPSATKNAATTANRPIRLLDTVIGPQYTGAPVGREAVASRRSIAFAPPSAGRGSQDGAGNEESQVVRRRGVCRDPPCARRGSGAARSNGGADQAGAEI